MGAQKAAWQDAFAAEAASFGGLEKAQALSCQGEDFNVLCEYNDYLRDEIQVGAFDFETSPALVACFVASFCHGQRTAIMTTTWAETPHGFHAISAVLNHC